MESLEGRQLLSVVSLIPVKDNTLFQSSAGSVSNGAGGSVLFGLDHYDNLAMRGLMAFDVAGSIPVGATINSVTLTVWVNMTFSATTPNVELHKVLANWGEAGSAPSGFMPPYGTARTGDATWKHTFYSNQFWTTPGGDFSATVSGVKAVGAANTSATWSSTAQMQSDVQGWLDNPTANYGWILKGDETRESGKMIDSRESVTTAHRPTLTINYTVATPTALDFGDAPNTYGTLLASDGARHTVGGPHLGATVGAKSDGQPSAAASSDPNDDGVFPITNMLAMPTAATTASFRIVASQAAKLDAWIDFNQNGVFDQPTEHLGGTASISLAAGDNLVAFTVPAGAKPGQTFGRFRISSAGNLGPKGAAPDGEVEDYAFTVLDGSAHPVVPASLPSGVSEVVLVGTDLVGRQGTTEWFRAPYNAVSRFDVSSTITTASVSLAGGWHLAPPQFVGAEFFRIVTQNGLTVHLAGLHPWQNPVNSLDTNNSETVTPLDVLLGINWINARGSGTLPLPPTPTNSPDGNFIDSNGDDKITPADLLLPINFINARVGLALAAAAQAEGESAVAPATAAGMAASPPTNSDLASRIQESPSAALSLQSAQGSLDNQLAEQAMLTAPPVFATEPSTAEAREAALLAESPHPVTAGPDWELNDPQLDTVLNSLAPDVARLWFAPS